MLDAVPSLAVVSWQHNNATVLVTKASSHFKIRLLLISPSFFVCLFFEKKISPFSLLTFSQCRLLRPIF